MPTLRNSSNFLMYKFLFLSLRPVMALFCGFGIFVDKVIMDKNDCLQCMPTSLLLSRLSDFFAACIANLRAIVS